MLKYFLIFDQIRILCYQFEAISTSLHVICCWLAIFELKTGKILPQKAKTLRNSLRQVYNVKILVLKVKIGGNFRF